MELTITAKADISEREFALTPDQADFDQVLIGKGGKYKLDFQNLDTTNVEWEIVSEPSDEYVKKYKIKKNKLKPEQTTQIEIELRDDIAPGAFKTALTLQPKGRSDKRFTVPITGTVVEKLTQTQTVASGSGKVSPTIKSKPAKLAKDEKPKAQIEPRKTRDPKLSNSKPAKQPIPVGTVDDSDLK